MNTPAGSMSFTLVSGRDEVANHWPAADGKIGTADDGVSASPSPTRQSEANSVKSYSYNAFDFGGGATETALLPQGMNAVTFLTGTVAADPTIGKSGGGALITAWTLAGTQPFPGHGSYSAVIDKVNSGTYDATTHALTMNIDFTANLAGGTAKATNFMLTGSAVYVESSSFGTATGDSYLDGLTIVARNLGAKALLYADANGTVPASSGGSGGSFPAMPLRAVLVGISQ